MAQTREAGYQELVEGLLSRFNAPPDLAQAVRNHMTRIEDRGDPYTPDDQTMDDEDRIYLVESGVHVRQKFSSSAQFIFTDRLVEKKRAEGLVTGDGRRVMLTYDEIVDLLRSVVTY